MSSSSGVYGRFEEVREVEDEIEGPGVDAGEDGIGGGGGVIDTERCIEAMWIAGRARQKMKRITSEPLELPPDH